MSLSNRPTVIHGVNVESLYKNGGQVRVFEQIREIHRGMYKEGFCGPFTTAVLKKLLSSKMNDVKHYTTAARLPQHVMNEILREALATVELCRDGVHVNLAPFLPFYDRSEIRLQRLHHNDVAQELKSVQAATITYKVKSGAEHQLGFYRFDSDKCYIMDANRFVASETPLEESIQVLLAIIKRSNPDTVEVTSVPIKIFPPINSSINSDKTNQPEVSVKPEKQTIPQAVESETEDKPAKSNLSETVKATVIHNFLNSYVSSLSKEFVTDFLASRQVEADTIKLVNHAVHSIISYALGHSISATITHPLISHILVKYFHFSEKTANDLMTGLALITAAVTAVTQPRNLKKSAITIAAGLGAGIAGDALARYTYGLVKNSLFADTGASNSPPAAAPSNVEPADDEAKTDEDWDYEVFGKNKNGLIL